MKYEIYLTNHYIECYYAIMDEPTVSDHFVKKYSPLVYTAIERRLKGYGFNTPREDILDIQQDVFISLLENRSLNSIHNPKSIPYWIAIVSGNAAMEYMRKRRRCEPEQKVSIFDKIDGVEVSDLILSKSPDPSEEIDRNKLSACIEKAITALPARQRLMIKLNLIHGKKYREISDIMKIPMGSVASDIDRAKRKLRVSLRGLK